MKLPSQKASSHAASQTASEKPRVQDTGTPVSGAGGGAQQPPDRISPKGPPTAAAGDDDLMSQRS
jgi:hypothetical protein